MKLYFLNPWINGAALAGSAVFSYPGRHYVLIGLMLFLPLMDRRWSPSSLPRARTNYLFWVGLLAISALLVKTPTGYGRYRVEDGIISSSSDSGTR